MTSPRAGVPRTVKGLSLVSLFNDVASEMVYPLLPAFVTRTLGGGATILGALDGAAELTSALVKWWSGKASDRPGWRVPLMMGGYLTAVLVRPLNAVASAAWQAVGFRVVDRVGKGFRTAPRDALIADLTPPEARGRAFGFHRGADHLGAVFGSVTAWWLLQRGTTVRDVIGLSVVPGLVAFLLLLVVLRPVHRANLAAQPDPPDAPSPPVRWEPVVALALLALARIPEALLLLRLQDLGIATATIPLLWGALHVVRAGGSYPGGWVTDRVGSRWTVAAGGAVWAAVMAALALPLAPGAAGIAFLAHGLVAGLTEPAERAMVSRLSPRRIGRSFGGYHALTGLAALPAALAFGALYERAGAPRALAASMVLSLVAVGWWLVVEARNGDRNDAADA